MEVRTLSMKQARRTIRADRERKMISRNVLCTPYSNKWPILNESSQSEILNTLKSVIVPLNIGKQSNTEKSAKKSKPFKRKEQRKHWKDGKQKRKYLVIGINEVTKTLEKDELCAILVNRDVEPALMMEHLITLSILRDIPAISVGQLGETISEIFQIKSCSALGFKKDVTEKINIFHEIYLQIKRLALPLYNDSDKFVLKTEEIISSKDIKEETLTDNEEKNKTEIDLTKFYIYKSSANYKKFDPRVLEDFIPLEGPSAKHKRKINNIGNEQNPKKLKTANVNYESANVKLIKSSGKLKTPKLKSKSKELKRE